MAVLRWWRVAALLLTGLYGVIAVQNLVEVPRQTIAAVVAMGLAALLLAGVALRARRRTLGTAMVIVAALPALGLWWTIVAPVAVVVVAAGALTDRQEPRATTGLSEA